MTQPTATNGAKKCRLVGIDTGGTFTDFIFADGHGQLHTLKRLSTPDNPARAIIEGMRELGLEDQTCRLVHGTTVVTNAVLEGKFARTAFLTNTGFADLLTLARQNREHIYTLSPQPLPAPVSGPLCLEIPVRCAADGTIVADQLNRRALEAITARLQELQVESVAICLLFSWRNADHEQRLAEHLRKHWPVSSSAVILPRIGEYERAVATWLNAALTPVISGYLGSLQQALPKANIAIMQSTGQTMAADQAVTVPVRMLLSGPAGGLAAVAALQRQQTDSDAGMLSFDMGGTSTDVALVMDRPLLTSRGRIDRWPVAVPMVDMHSIGAGGGSIAWLDAAGALQIGPQSAGANPGPACYQRGGELPTVTDAHIVLGHLPEDIKLGGYLELSRAQAQAAFQQLSGQLRQSIEDVARDVLRLADERMARALQLMSAQRGHDPAQLQLVSFGGAGGLHVCSLAQRLGMRRAMVPVHAGVLSALGMLLAPAGRELTHSVLEPLNQVSTDKISAWLQQLTKRARDELQREGINAADMHVRQQLDCSYRGQKDSISIIWDKHKSREDLELDFHHQHEQLNGHRLEHEIMLVNVRSSVSAAAALRQLPDWQQPDQQLPDADAPGNQQVAGLARAVPVYRRAMLADKSLPGPAIISDAEATVWVASGWQAGLDAFANILLRRTDGDD